MYLQICTSYATLLTTATSLLIRKTSVARLRDLCRPSTAKALNISLSPRFAARQSLRSSIHAPLLIDDTCSTYPRLSKSRIETQEKLSKKLMVSLVAIDSGVVLQLTNRFRCIASAEEVPLPR